MWSVFKRIVRDQVCKKKPKNFQKNMGGKTFTRKQFSIYSLTFLENQFFVCLVFYFGLVICVLQALVDRRFLQMFVCIFLFFWLCVVQFVFMVVFGVFKVFLGFFCRFQDFLGGVLYAFVMCEGLYCGLLNIMM